MIPDGVWYRTCQECGHEQIAKQPDLNKELTNSYRDTKCKRCKSEALDYGTTRNSNWNPESEEN